jgi:plastocyanin
MRRIRSGSMTFVLSALLCATAACGDGPTTAADASPDAPAGDAAADSGAEDGLGAEVSVDTGTDVAATDGGSDAAETGADAAMQDSGSDPEPDAGGPFTAIAPCLTASTYVTTPRVVSTGAHEYLPPCLRVPAGASVQIEASAVHPVEPRAGGSTGNPITGQLGTTTVTFPTPGFYPFLCPEHVDQGMIGVIWVTP